MNLGQMGNAWISAAVFERNRLDRIKRRTSRDGVTPQIRRLVQEGCERDIQEYEYRAMVTLKAALVAEAQTYEFKQVA
jgi:hypothetical protein